MVFRGRKREHGSPKREKDIDDLHKESSITITNVPYNVRWEFLRDLFVKEVGEVIYVKLFKDDNDRPTGVGYVTFDTPELAEIAKSKLDRYPINDRRELVVKDASYIDHCPISPRKKKDIEDFDKESSITITNVPYNIKWDYLKELFVKEVGEVLHVKLFNDDQDRPTGVGYVTFDTPELAEIAKSKLDRYPVNDLRELVIKDANYIERFKTNRSTQNKRPKLEEKQDLRRRLQPSNIGRYGDGINLYGLSPQFLQSLDINPTEELHSRVFIKNLDFGLDENQLRNVFQVAGRVICAKIFRDPQDGKSSGRAVVEYTHPVEAVQAISMLNGQNLYDRKLVVKSLLDQSLVDDCYVYSRDRLPDGLRNIGMGLGPNGMPLVDVANNLPKMFPQSNQTNPMEMQINVPLPQNQTLNVAPQNQTLNVVPQNHAFNIVPQNQALNVVPQNQSLNVTALEALGKSIIANQQTNTNAITTALGVLQSVPGFSGVLNNLATNNILGAGNVSSLPVAQVPVQPAVKMDTSLSPSTVSLSNLLQSVQGQLPIQDNSEKSKQEAMLQAMQSQLLPQSNQAMMAPQKNDQSFSLFERNSTQSVKSEPDELERATMWSNPCLKQGEGSFNGSGIRYSQTSPTLIDTVVVRNLPGETTSEILKEGFNQCGDIKYCEIKGPGTGLIRFDGAKAAQMAIARMNNVSIAGKNLVVEYL